MLGSATKNIVYRWSWSSTVKFVFMPRVVIPSLLALGASFSSLYSFTTGEHFQK